MIHFVGAGSGAPDLITVRGKKYLEEADVVIYAGSLVNPKLLEYTKDICTIYNSAKMTLEEVLSVMEKAEAAGKTTVRLHTGDPCIYGAIREQMDVLDEKGIAYDYCPGVSAFCGAASALNLEYTLPDISQSVIITRMEGRTPVPPKESIQSFAAHQATMVVFLSTGMLEELSRRLIEGGYTADTPAAIVYKATWEDEKKFVCTVGTLAQTAKENHITKTALMIIGDCVNAAHYDRSKLYDPGFTTEFRELVFFGMDGFVTGPTLAVLFVTVWQIFIAEFGANAPVSPAASAIPGVIPVRPQPDSSVPTEAKKSKAPRKSRGQR